MKQVLAALLLFVVAPAFAQTARPEARPEGWQAVQGALAAEAWDDAARLAAAEGGVAELLVTWTRLRAGAGTFPEYGRFLAAHPGWPGLERLRAAGEKTISPETDAALILAFFHTSAPQTGEGAAAFARALIESGRREEAEATLRAAWLGLPLDEAGEAALRTPFAALLDPLAAERAEAMLWRWRTSDAERLLPLLPVERRALAEARIAFIRGAGNAQAALAAVSAAYADDPGLAYDRMNAAATAGDYTAALALLTTHSTSAQALGQPFRWASWRASIARWLMREGRAREAYDLAAAHHLTEGDLWADLEWLCGFIALTDLNDAARAEAHFRSFLAGTSGPISLSRGQYWLGRALEVQGQAEAARAAYAEGARHQTAFYGLLSAEKLGQSLAADVLAPAPPVEWAGAPFLQSEIGQALQLLLTGNDWVTNALFVLRLGNDLGADDLHLMAAFLEDEGEPFLLTILGKAAVERGILIAEAYYPLHPLAEMDLPVAPELALSIARRESEFNQWVGSAVGAQGLMQLMPATAREVSEELGLDYSRARLTEDWRYNATLGAAYLADLEARFGASPVMIAAGYNAGPSRPMAWMAERGDPRDAAAGVDVVDWIEHIPFSETRNYVMRVAESIPVYQARLGRAAPGPVQFTTLLNGQKPFIRPLARPDAARRAAYAEAVALQEAGPPETARRPEARPAGAASRTGQ